MLRSCRTKRKVAVVWDAAVGRVATAGRDRACMLLTRLVDGLSSRWLCEGEADIAAITVDEREVCPGALFIAQPGYYGDGHDRLEQARRAGAAALAVRDPARVTPTPGLPVVQLKAGASVLGRLSARFYGEPTGQLAVYGVTGTNGKTSVTHLLEHMLVALGERPALMGTVAYRLGPVTHRATNTTPDALFVHRFARQAVAAGASCLVLEVSSHGLALARTEGVWFDRVGFTNLTHEHLDFHGSLAAYQAAKQRLFSEALVSARAAGKAPRAAACVDGAAGVAMLEVVPAGVETMPVARARAAAGARGVSIEPLASLGTRGIRYRLSALGRSWIGTTPLLGRYNLDNIALAVAMVGDGDAERFEAAVASTASFTGVPGRMEPIVSDGQGEPRVFVDYAHTPDALEQALGVLGRLDAGPVTVVVGCGGDRDAAKRPLMALAAQRGAHQVVLTSDNPRSEDPGQIIDAMERGLQPQGPRVRRVLDRSTAIEQALTGAGAGVCLIAGKGHEPYQQWGEVRHHLDDREEARRCLVAQRRGQAAWDTPLYCGWSARRRERAGRGWGLVDGVVDEARARRGGLGTVAVLDQTTLRARDLARRLIAERIDERVLFACDPGDLASFAAQLEALCSAHHALVVAAAVSDDATRVALLRHVGADIVVAPARAGPRLGIGPATVLLSTAQAFGLSRAQWAELLEHGRQQAHAERGGGAESRPIPVPDGLELRPPDG